MLLDPARCIDQMRDCGASEPARGDGLLALPTLIHQGPGCPRGTRQARGRARKVLFFSVRPTYPAALYAPDGDDDVYDSSAQVQESA